MEKFINLTSDLSEKAFKIGPKVPDGSVNLSWFSSQEISPRNNVIFYDLSETIPENRSGKTMSDIVNVSSGSAEFSPLLAFADELGFLRTLDGNYTFSSSDVTISNIFLGKKTSSSLEDIETLNPSDFIHYFYVSKYFAPGPYGFSLNNLNEFLTPEKIKDLKIKVVYDDGSEYIDKNSNRKKYRILIEPFLTETNSRRTEIPYRIIVLLDSSNPTNLKLVYDKVEADANGNLFGLNINYSESINPVKYFKEVPEEAFVIDPNYRDQRIFSITKINQKYHEQVGKEIVENGYQIVAPNKGVDDNRTFELFNWRLISKVNQSINLSLIEEDDIFQVKKTIKACVLTSSTHGAVRNKLVYPYIFHRLQNSPFNLAQFEFINPIGQDLDLTPNRAAYWKVDIDQVEDLNQFDIVAWAPNSSMSTSQAAKLSNFIGNNGTVFLDLSYSHTNQTELNQFLSISTEKVVADYTVTDTTNVLTDSAQNGGWSLEDFIYEDSNFGIFGSKWYIKGDRYKRFFYFDQLTQPNSSIFLSSGQDEENTQPIGLILKFPNNGDTLSCGNIIATTARTMAYCNKIYSTASKEQVVDHNIDSQYSEYTEANIYPGIVEGPLKFLYNVVSHTVYSRLQSSREFRTNSSVYKFLGPWNSSWVVNQDVLLDDEKKKYFKEIEINSGGTRLVRSLYEIPTTNYFKYILQEYYPDFLLDKLNNNTTSIDYYIEITNKDINLSNSIEADPDVENIDSSDDYLLYKVYNSDLPVAAYTNKYSPPLYIPEGIGPYAILEKEYKSSDKNVPINPINIISNLKSYPFSLETKYTYLQANDKPKHLNVDYTAQFKALYKGKLIEKRKITVDPDPTVDENTHLVNSSVECKDFKSAVDNNLARTTKLSDSYNTFLYSGDIGIHNDTRTWKYIQSTSSVVSSTYTVAGYTYVKDGYIEPFAWSDGQTIVPTYVYSSSSSPMRHEYVKYIQFTVSASTGKSIKVDGIYGPITDNTVREFQIKYNQRYIDGNVDSETKSYLAFFWKNLKNNNREYFNNLLNLTKNNPDLNSITKYIERAVNSGTVENIGTETYKKITFSGFNGPKEAKDIIFLRIPKSIVKLNKLIIEADSNSIWQNFSIDACGYSSKEITNIFNTTNISLDKKVKNGKIEISFNNIDANKARYIWLQFVGGPIAGFGYAEGFSIKSIKANGSVVLKDTDEEPTTDYEYVTQDIYALATVNVTDLIKNITIQNSKRKKYKTNSPFYSTTESKTSELVSLVVDCLSDGTIPAKNILKNGPVTLTEDLSSIDFQLDEETDFSLTHKLQVSFNFSKSPILLYIENIEKNSVTSNGNSLSTDHVDIQYINGPKKKISIVKAATSSVFYSDSLYYESTPTLISNYKLKNIFNYILPDERNSVDISDGTLLLCDTNGLPIGIPNATQMNIGLAEIANSLSREVHTVTGSIVVDNIYDEDDGFIYGFYDQSRKEFLGKQITYIELIRRGANNIFIGVAAIDADGNFLNQNEYLGPKVDITFKPVNVPVKLIAPIYSVNIRKSTAIRVENIDENITKFDAWELPVSSGSFWKKIHISKKRPWIDWKDNYIGQDLLALYSTMDDFRDLGSGNFDSDPTIWSKIHGYGNYDIKDEKPILIDSMTIRARRTPLLNINYPTDNFDSIAGIIKQDIKIYTRPNVESGWTEVSENLIKDINSATGIIKFKQSIVPSDDSLIKISYTRINRNKLIHQIDGEIIPLNPIYESLYSTGINFDSPLYIYILPKFIYKYSDSSQSQFIKLDEYTSNLSISFTYDSTKFSPTSVNYDPFALPIAILYVTNNPYNQQPALYDTRVRGGGVTQDIPISELIENVPDILSHWDVYPSAGTAYNSGGYVIIRIPEEVKDHFIDQDEIHQIISNNLTAGIAYKLQDMNGENWI